MRIPTADPEPTDDVNAFLVTTDTRLLRRTLAEHNDDLDIPEVTMGRTAGQGARGWGTMTGGWTDEPLKENDQAAASVSNLHEMNRWEHYSLSFVFYF